MEIFNYCLGHGKRSSFQLSDICPCVHNNCIPPKPMSPPPAPSYSSAGSSQPLIPDMPTYVGKASLWTNLNFSWEQVSLVWESNRLFSASLFYIWVYICPVSCKLALTHTYICVFIWGETKFQSHSLFKCPYNYSVIFNFNFRNRNDKKLKVVKDFMWPFVSESLGNPAEC